MGDSEKLDQIIGLLGSLNSYLNQVLLELQMLRQLAESQKTQEKTS
jgi:hypothetical protein